MKLSPLQQQALAPQLQPMSTGVGIVTWIVLAGVAYGGYRLYKHVRKG